MQIKEGLELINMKRGLTRGAGINKASLDYYIFNFAKRET